MPSVGRRELRGGGYISDSYPRGAGTRGMVKSRMVQQVSRSLDRAEGQLRHSTPRGRLVGCLFGRWQLADVARAKTLLQTERRGEHSTAQYQVVLLLKPKDLWDVSWPATIEVLYLTLSTKQRLMLIMFRDERTMQKQAMLLMFRRIFTSPSSNKTDYISPSRFTIDDQSACLCVESHFGTHDQISSYIPKVSFFIIWGVPSHKRMGLPFVE